MNKKNNISKLLVTTMLFSFSLAYANEGELKKIPEVNSVNHHTLKHKKYVPDEKKFEIKIFKNIKYDKLLFEYSLFNPNKETFKEFLSKNDITKYNLKKLFGKTDSKLAILISAFGYDWVYHKPEIAENFYKHIGKKINLKNKIYIADYYLRTGRPEMITSVLSKVNCLTSFKDRKKCFYYLGLKKLLVDQKPHNLYFRLIKSKIPKAKEIWEKYK